MLGASGVQISQNNLDNLRSTEEEEEDGATEVLDPQDVPGSVLLEITYFEILDSCAITSRGMGSLRGTLFVTVTLVKGNTFPTKVKVLPVDLDLELAFISETNSRKHNLCLASNIELLH
ncbi:hypothetical protein Tco_0005487 [Tanacetum coccineum]